MESSTPAAENKRYKTLVQAVTEDFCKEEVKYAYTLCDFDFSIKAPGANVILSTKIRFVGIMILFYGIDEI